MKKIISSNILFTRTLQLDYRWIYWDENISDIDKYVFNQEIKKFENDKFFFLQNNHLFCRKLTNGIALYKFFDTQKFDSNMRKIYALSGFLFLGKQCDIAYDVLSSITADAFLNLECNSEEIYDNTQKQNKFSDYPIQSLYNKLFLENQTSLLNVKKEIEMFLMCHENKNGFLIFERNEQLNFSEFEDLDLSSRTNQPTSTATGIKDNKKSKVSKRKKKRFFLLGK